MSKAQQIAKLEETLEAQEHAAKRFALYMRFAKDARLKSAFASNHARILQECVYLRGELKRCGVHLPV